MKITIDAKDFTDALKSINWSGRSAIANLEYAIVEADESIRLSRTNLELYVTQTIPGVVEGSGKCLVPVKKALAVLKNCKGEISLEFDGEYLKIGNFLLDTFPVEDYPQPPEEAGKPVGTVPGHVLMHAIKETAPWKGDFGNPCLDNFCLRKGQLVASDGACLKLVETGLDYEGPVVIDHSLALLQKFNLEGEVRVARSKEWLSLEADGFKATVRLVDCEYPPYWKVTPAEGYPLKVDAAALSDGLKEAIAYAKTIIKGGVIPVYLQWLEDRMEIFGDYEGKVFRKTIQEHRMPFPVSIPVNAAPLHAAVKKLNGEITIWHPGDFSRPFVITDGAAFMYLQMPLNIDDFKDCARLPEDVSLREIPYSPDPGVIPEPTRKRTGSRKRRAAGKASRAQAGNVSNTAFAELKARADFWEAEALKKEEHIRNLEAEMEKMREAYRFLLQFQALRPNGKGRYAIIDGHKYLFSQGRILDEDGREVGRYNRSGGEIMGRTFKLQQEWVVSMN